MYDTYVCTYVGLCITYDTYVGLSFKKNRIRTLRVLEPWPRRTDQKC